jgi:hypothetical protein
VYRVLIVLIGAFCFGSQAAAQNATTDAAITGVVLDPAEAAVVGAKVTLQSREGTALINVRADATGSFRFEGIKPGSYTITVEQRGFQPAASRVRVGVRPPAAFVIRLKVAEVKSEVTVTEQSNQLSVNNADNRDTVSLDRKALDDLPIFDQDYVTTMTRFLDAGAVATGGVTLIVDGLEATRAPVSFSAIQEVKINQDPYSAEFPRPGRGRIEIITRPQSPQFHGVFNFVLRDYHLNARDPFLLTRPFEQRRIFEGSLTGPLGRGGKTSFLITANRQEEDLQAIIFAQGLSGPIQETLPTPSRNTEIGGSITHLIGEHLISVRGLYTGRSTENQGVGGLNLPETAANFEDREDIVSFNYRGPIHGKFYNLFRFYTARQHTPTTSVSPAPKIVVLGAFTGGGAQGDRLQTENHIALSETVVWSGQKHTVRFGVNVPDISRRGLDDNTNTGGTYTFASLADYQQGRPFSVVRHSGNGHVVFVEKLVGGFVQDEFKLRSNLQITAGLRYDWQNYFDYNRAFAPRASFAWSSGKTRKFVIRGGAGFFYDRTGPLPIFDLIRYDGHRLLQYVINDPPYPDPGATGSTSIVRPRPGGEVAVSNPIRDRNRAPTGKVDHHEPQLLRNARDRSISLARRECAATTVLSSPPQPALQRLETNRVFGGPKEQFSGDRPTRRRHPLFLWHDSIHPGEGLQQYGWKRAGRLPDEPKQFPRQRLRPEWRMGARRLRSAPSLQSAGLGHAPALFQAGSRPGSLFGNALLDDHWKRRLQ